MQIFIVIALVIAIIAVVFALQNLVTITVSFMVWSIQGSLALVLLVTLAVGVLISALASMPGLIRNKWTTTGQKKKLAMLEAERNNYRKKAEEAQKDVTILEEQVANLSAHFEQNPPEEKPQPEKPI